MSNEQRSDRRDFRNFQQGGQSGSYRSERSDSDANETNVKTIHEDVMICNVHNIESCHECNRSAKKCHAMLNSEVTLECSCKLPVIADACQCHKERMPVCIGTMDNQNVSALRDTQVALQL